MIKRLFILPSLLCLLAGCFNQKESQVEQNGVIYCAEGSPETFNPQLITSGTTIDMVGKVVYNRLLEFDTHTGELLPALAERWSSENAGTRLHFYLRKDVQFHTTRYFTPTRALNADDVLFSFKRILDSDHPYHQVSGGRYPFFQGNSFTELVTDIVKIDDHHLVFELAYPDNTFLYDLATDFAVILSKEYSEQLLTIEHPERIDTQPIGTGPYKFKRYKAGSWIRYLKHENYWRAGDSNIEQLVMDISPRNAMRIAKLITGECDIAAYPVATELDLIKKNPDLSLESTTNMNVGYWAFNTQKPPFDDPLVRQALAHAIDRQAILEAVYFNNATLASGLLPPSSWAFSESSEGREYSPEEARRLLKAAGWSQGFSMDIWAMPIQRTYNPNARKMAEMIQDNLAQIGIRANIVSYEWGTFRRKLRDGEHDSVLIGWVADNTDPNGFFSPLLSCVASVTGSNRANWCEPEFDNLLHQAVITDNREKRKRLYVEAQALINEQVPLVSLAHSKRFQAVRKEVKGAHLTPLGGVALDNLTKEVP